MVKDFKKWMYLEGMADNTIENYVMHVSMYLDWFRDSYGLEAKKIYRENVLEYISFLKNICNYSASTFNIKLNSLKKFNEFLIEQGNQTENVIFSKDKIKIQESIRTSELEKKDIDRIRQCVLENEGKKMYAIITLLSYAGLRISECLEIKLTDIDLASRELVVIGKGNKRRVIPLHQKVVDALREYIKERPDKGNYLFPGKTCGHMHRTTINKLIDRYSGDYQLTPHSFRAFFCTHMLDNGFSLTECAYFLGHSNVRTTSLYLSTNKKKLKDRINTL